MAMAMVCVAIKKLIKISHLKSSVKWLAAAAAAEVELINVARFMKKMCFKIFSHNFFNEVSVSENIVNEKFMSNRPPSRAKWKEWVNELIQF